MAQNCNNVFFDNAVAQEEPRLTNDDYANVMGQEEPFIIFYAGANTMAPEEILSRFGGAANVMAREKPLLAHDATANVMAQEEPLVIFDVATSQIVYQVRSPNLVEVQAPVLPNLDDPFLTIGNMLGITPSWSGLSALEVTGILNECEERTVYYRYRTLHCASSVSIQQVNSGLSENRPVFESQQPPPPPPEKRFICHTCDKEYKTKQSWKAHFKKKHPDFKHEH